MILLTDCFVSSMDCVCPVLEPSELSIIPFLGAFFYLRFFKKHDSDSFVFAGGDELSAHSLRGAVDAAHASAFSQV
jgi:hypothetical protein